MPKDRTLAEQQKKWPDNPHLEQKPMTREERITALIAGYELGLLHAAPRTQVELDEIKALLEVDGQED